MANRLDLQAKFESILGSRNVYHQPPASINMKYTAIRYSRKDISTRHANNGIYNSMTVYEVILIDANPDSVFVDKIAQLPYCSFDRQYAANNLNHYVFTLYF